MSVGQNRDGIVIDSKQIDVQSGRLNFDSNQLAYTSEVANISGDLQTQIDNISGGSGFTPLEGEGMTITPSGDDYIFSVEDYISKTEVSNISGGFTPLEGEGMTITPSGDDYVFAVDDYISKTEVADVSGDLQTQIDSLESQAVSGGTALYDENNEFVVTMDLSGGIVTSLVPDTSGAYDLGSSDLPWRDIHIDNAINLDGYEVTDLKPAAGALKNLDFASSFFSNTSTKYGEFNTSTDSLNIDLTPGLSHKITVTTPGLYRVFLDATFRNTSADDGFLLFKVRKNGVIFDTMRVNQNSAGDYFSAHLEFFDDAVVDDYYEVYDEIDGATSTTAFGKACFGMQKII